MEKIIHYIILTALCLCPLARAELFGGSLADLENEEAHVVESFQHLQRHGLSTEALIQDLQKATSDEAKQTIYRRWQIKTQEFQANYDGFNGKKLDFLIQRYREFATQMKDRVETSSLYSEKEKEKVQSLFQTLEGNFQRYVDHQGILGTHEDRQRTLAMNEFLTQVQQLATVAGRPNQTWSQWFSQKVDALHRNLRMKSAQLGIVATAPITLARVFMGKNTVMAAKLPLRTALMLQGRRLKVSGKENISTAPKPGTLRLIVMPHAHNVNDLSTLATLAKPKTAMVSIPWPSGKLGSYLESKPELIHIPVDDGPGMGKQMAERVKAGEIDTVAFFPESAMPAYGYEVRPLQKRNGPMVQTLLSEGVPVEIVPVAFPRHAQFLSKIAQGHSPLDSSTLPVQIQSPIPAEVVAFLASQGEGVGLGDVIRQIWLESYAKDNFQNRQLGMPSVKTLVENIDQRLTGNTGCPYANLQ